MKHARTTIAAAAICVLSALALWAAPADPAAAPDAGAPSETESARAAAHEAAASAATAQAAAAKALAAADPWVDPRATRRGLGYASPWTLLAVGVALVVLAFLIGRFAPRKKRRVRRAAILYVLYVTTFIVAASLHTVHSDTWSHRIWVMADLFEVLTVITLAALAAFGLVLLTQ